MVKKKKSDPKYVFAVVFFVFITVLAISFAAYNLGDDSNNNIQGHAIAAENLEPFKTDDLEGVDSVGELFSLFDRNKDGYLSYEEFKLSVETVIE